MSQKTLAVLPTFLSQLIKIAEFLIKTERKICKNTQNILLDGCYQLFEEYLHENTSFHSLKPGREIGQSFVFLSVFGIILGFADPITDILTLVEFYREDHTTCFGVGLTFVVLPCFVFLLNYYVLKKSELKKVSIARRCTQVILCAANPFFPAFLKLQTLFSYLKNFTNFWRGNKVSRMDPANSDEEAQ